MNDSLATEVERLTAEIERVNQYLDECYIGGDRTEPLLERVSAAMRAAYLRGVLSRDVI